LSVTLNPPPPRLGITHWSTRLLARELGVSRDTIARIWREYGVQPWRAETFKFSTDPQLAAKVHDVVGLYLHPPERAVVLCVDEKSQIQALERTQPVRGVWPGRPEQRTHDYTRHGTTTLFAALEVATGRVLDQCRPRHRHQEFLAFLKQVARAWPRRQLHVVCDNYATHKHPVVRGWLAKHPRIQLHYTPTSASWLNLVEVFFSIVERQALRRGDFASVSELATAISRSAPPGTSTASRLLGPSPPMTSWPGSTVTPLNRGPPAARPTHGHGGPAFHSDNLPQWRSLLRQCFVPLERYG
jgi:transposase